MNLDELMEMISNLTDEEKQLFEEAFGFFDEQKDACRKFLMGKQDEVMKYVVNFLSQGEGYLTDKMILESPSSHNLSIEEYDLLVSNILSYAKINDLLLVVDDLEDARQAFLTYGEFKIEVFVAFIGSHSESYIRLVDESGWDELYAFDYFDQKANLH